MLKKGLHIIIIVMLLGSTTGFGISRHYCQDSLVSVDIIKTSDSCCNDNSCCNYEHEFLRIESDFVNTALQHLPHIQVLAANIHIEARVQVLSASNIKYYHRYSSGTPPLLPTTALALQQSFLL